MRRTKVNQIYETTGNPRAVQLLLGHTKMDSTVRYLGVELKDARAIAEDVEIQSLGPSSPTARAGLSMPCLDAAVATRKADIRVA